MSAQSLSRFREELAIDADLLERVARTRTAEELVSLANDYGFTIDIGDIRGLRPAGEMSEEELEAVAGGTTFLSWLGLSGPS